MAWRISNALDTIEQHAEIVDALNLEYYGEHPLLSSEFVIPLVRWFGTSRDFIVSSGHGGAARKLAILRRRDALRWQTMLPSQAPIAPVWAPVGDSSEFPLGVLPGCAMLMDWLSQDPHISALASRPLEAKFDSARHAETMSIRLDGDYETYWRSRSGKLRSNLRRYSRRLDELGVDSRFGVVEEEAELLAALERYGNLESEGWKGQAGTAVHMSNVQGRFYADVLRNFARRGRARIFEMYVGGALVASRIAVNSDRMIVMLKTTYDESAARFAPGRLLLRWVLQHEFSLARSRWVEFYTNATADMLTWATDSRPISNLTQYRSSSIHFASRLLRSIRNKLRSRSTHPTKAGAGGGMNNPDGR